MIRLGSLAGYPFEGPRVLAGWTPPARAGGLRHRVQARARAKPEQYAVIYVGHADDLSAERFPFNHPRASCWVRRARRAGGSSTSAPTRCPAGCRSHREQIARELIADLPARLQRASSTTRRGRTSGSASTTAPTTGPLTTGRDPAPGSWTRPRPALGLGIAVAVRLRTATGRSRRRRAAASGAARRPAGPAPARPRVGRLVGGAGDDPLGHAVQQRQRAGDDPTGAVDVLDAGSITSALRSIVRTSSAHSSRFVAIRVSCDADDVQVEGQPGDEQDDVDDGQTRRQRGHERTFPRTRPRNRWCSRPSASTASTSAAVSAISAVSAVLAAACLQRVADHRRPGGRSCAPAAPGW